MNSIIKDLTQRLDAATAAAEKFAASPCHDPRALDVLIFQADQILVSVCALKRMIEEYQ